MLRQIFFPTSNLPFGWKEEEDTAAGGDGFSREERLKQQTLRQAERLKIKRIQQHKLMGDAVVLWGGWCWGASWDTLEGGWSCRGKPPHQSLNPGARVQRSAIQTGCPADRGMVKRECERQKRFQWCDSRDTAASQWQDAAAFMSSKTCSWKETHKHVVFYVYVYVFLSIFQLSSEPSSCSFKPLTLLKVRNHTQTNAKQEPSVWF